MKNVTAALKQHFSISRGAREKYVQLRKHLNRQPVGYPSTPTGVEIRLLQEIFSLEEAEIAVILDYKFMDFNTVCQKVGKVHGETFGREKLQALLDSMESKGCIFVRLDKGEKQYALHPFVIGMFEMQIKRMTPSYYLDTRSYVLQGFAAEYLTTGAPQMRAVPVQKSIRPEHHVATYDEIRSIVEQAREQICITECICKTGHDLVGKPCQVTERREICIAFRDYADLYVRQGWGRWISRDECMEILDQNEKDGLMLFSSNMQQPQFVCSCCSCCCGLIEMIRNLPHPADFTAGNYCAHLDASACNGCGKCIKRCQMKAIAWDDPLRRVKFINSKRCVGCGLCVATCKNGALSLVGKLKSHEPPEDHDALMELIMANKKKALGKMLRMWRAATGRKM